jgi:2-polyprenyl-3-methyl-5-hydroxy-6-metoxy-1,4-benzoquinol methylase
MPSSQHYHISKIVSLIITLNPGSVLDIGTGFGKYGMLCREYLELWDGRKKYSEFMRRIDGIEAFEDYITPVHRFVYNNMYIEDALKIVDKLDFKYDLILLIDVLEHFEKSTGRSFLEKMLQLHGGVLVSTPK